MRSTRLAMSPDGATGFDFSAPCVDADTEVQNAMVNLGTAVGSDPLYPDRGTTLLLDGLRGRMINQAWADSMAATAAAQTLLFLQSQEAENDAFGLVDLKLNSTQLVGQTLQLNLWIKLADGSTRGQLLNL